MVIRSIAAATNDLADPHRRAAHDLLPRASGMVAAGYYLQPHYPDSLCCRGNTLADSNGMLFGTASERTETYTSSKRGELVVVSTEPKMTLENIFVSLTVAFFVLALGWIPVLAIKLLVMWAWSICFGLCT